MLGLTASDEWFPTIDHSTVRKPVSVRARLTVEPAATAIAGGVARLLTVKSALAATRVHYA
jgi:hypothetical protein